MSDRGDEWGLSSFERWARGEKRAGEVRDDCLRFVVVSTRCDPQRFAVGSNWPNHEHRVRQLVDDFAFDLDNV